MIGLARLAGPIACFGLAVLFMARTRNNRIAGLCYAGVGAELLLAAAMKLYEAGRLSSGAAAELAGVPKSIFVERLADYAVPAFRQNTAELHDEAANA